MPIVGGGRVTGKIGAFDVGALNIQTDEDTLADAEMTNVTVVRVKRDILRRSTVGGIFTNRSVALAGDAPARPAAPTRPSPSTRTSACWDTWRGPGFPIPAGRGTT